MSRVVYDPDDEYYRWGYYDPDDDYEEEECDEEVSDL